MTRGPSAAERKRALAAARQRRYVERKRHKALVAAGLPVEDAPPMTKADLATIIAAKIVERLDDDDLDLLDRDVQGLMRLGINVEGLKLKQETKRAPASGGFILEWINGLHAPAPLQLEDGIIEGEAVEIDTEHVRDGLGGDLVRVTEDDIAD